LILCNLATLNKLYTILVDNAKVVNRVSKSAQKENIVKKMYQLKDENIINAVEIIEKTKTKSVVYSLGYDEEKKMNFILFKFKKIDKYMKVDGVCFHIRLSVYNKILEIQNQYH